MEADNDSEPLLAATRPALVTGSQQSKAVPVVGEKRRSISPPAAESRSRVPCGSHWKRPRSSRSRSPVFPPRRSSRDSSAVKWVDFSTGLPTEKPITYPIFTQRPGCMMEGLSIDWDTLEKTTASRRVFTLRKILSFEQTSDTVKILLVKQKCQGFEEENMLLKLLRDADTKDLPSPVTPEDDRRKIMFKYLFAQFVQMHKSLYHNLT